MHNPFEVIEARLSSIENLILDLKHQPQKPEEVKNSKELLTVQEAANFLDLSVATIYTKVSRSELPCMKRSKRLYFSRIELMEYLKAGRKLTNAEIEANADEFLTKKKGLNYGK